MFLPPPRGSEAAGVEEGQVGELVVAGHISHYRSIAAGVAACKAGAGLGRAAAGTQLDLLLHWLCPSAGHPLRRG